MKIREVFKKTHEKITQFLRRTHTVQNRTHLYRYKYQCLGNPPGKRTCTNRQYFHTYG